MGEGVLPVPLATVAGTMRHSDVIANQAITQWHNVFSRISTSLATDVADTHVWY